MKWGLSVSERMEKKTEIIGQDYKSRNVLEYHRAQNGSELCPEKSQEGFTTVHMLWGSKT